MICRKSNLPMSDADRIYQTNNLRHTIHEMLQNEYVYKQLWFYKPELIEKWEDDPSEENAEIIAKHIIRMASRNTVNQLFGIVMADGVQSKENYFLSADYIRHYLHEKVIESFCNGGGQIQIGDLLQERPDAYYIHTYLNGSRKDLIFRKDTILGKILSYVKGKKTVSGIDLCEFLEKNQVGEGQIKSIIELLYNTGAVTSEIDVETLAFQGRDLAEIGNSFLKEADISLLKKMSQEMSILNKLNLKQYKESVRNIEKQARGLIGKPFQNRIICGYRRENSGYLPNNRFGISKKLKEFFEVLGKNSQDYAEMRGFETEFVVQYGLFQAVPLIEVLPLYRRRKNDFQRSEQYNQQEKIFRDLLRRAQAEEREEIELSNDDLDRIIETENGKSRIRTTMFDFKYRKYGKDIVLSDIVFAFKGALTCAYLSAEEMGVEKVEDEAYLYYCPQYLADIGCPRARENGARIRIYSKGEQDLGIERLAVTADFDGMHLMDLKSRREILPINPTMKSFQYQIESEAMEFLDKLGRYLTMIPSATLPIEREEWTHVPRIRYKNMVLQPQRWLIRSEDLNCCKMRDYLRRGRISRYVYLMTETGEERYMDLQSDLACKWLAGYGKRHDYAILVEAFHQEGQQFDYIMDVEYKKRGKRVGSGFYKENTKKIPQSSKSYTSWHLIYSPSCLKEIQSALSEYLSKVKKRFFFIHYIEDGKNVIRLRVKDDIYESSKACLQDLMERELIESFSMQNYKPEIIRYGGMEYISKFEELFEKESEICLNINIRLNIQDILYIQMIVILAMLINVLGEENVGLFLSAHIEKEKPSTNSHFYLQSNKKMFLQGVEQDISQIKLLFQDIDKNLKKYIGDIQKENTDDYAEYVLLSMLHMRLNRFAGISGNREEEAFCLAETIYKTYSLERKRRDEKCVGDR